MNSLFAALLVTISLPSFANICSTPVEHNRYVTDLGTTLVAFAYQRKQVEDETQAQLHQKLAELSENGILSAEQAESFFNETLQEPEYLAFEREKRITEVKFKMQVTLALNEQDTLQQSCISAQKALSLFEEMHQVNLAQYTLLHKQLESKELAHVFASNH